VVLAEKGIGLDISIEVKRVDSMNATSKALQLMKNGYKVLLVFNNAWSLWYSIAKEAWMRGENYFLLEALDPYEAILSGASLQSLAAARITYLSRLPAENVEYERVNPAKKEVSRRALIASAILGASLAPVEKPFKSSLCSVKGIDTLCQACLEECNHNACSTAICPIELLLVPSYSREALLDYLRILKPDAPGYAVFASRWSLGSILQELKKYTASFRHRVYLIPVGCPYVVGLEELLALRAMGLKPIIVGSKEAHRDPYCEKSREVYAETVLNDYERLTGDKTHIYWPQEAAKIVAEPPGIHPILEPMEAKGTSLRTLALRELERNTIKEAQKTRTILLGQVHIDPDKCTLCSACIKACPTNALRQESSDNIEAIFFKPANCIACKYCSEVCPENAIKVWRQVPPKPHNWYKLVEDEEEYCLACSKPLAPRRQLSMILIKLRNRGLSAEALIPILLCEECKIKYQLGLVTIDIDQAKAKIEELAKRVKRPGKQTTQPTIPNLQAQQHSNTDSAL
jgi:ferredoxin